MVKHSSHLECRQEKVRKALLRKSEMIEEENKVRAIQNSAIPMNNTAVDVAVNQEAEDPSPEEKLNELRKQERYLMEESAKLEALAFFYNHVQRS